MATQWFVLALNKEHGPFSSQQLKHLASLGDIRPDTSVKKGPDGKWVNAEKVQGLFEPQVPPLPPAAQPTSPATTAEGKRRRNPLLFVLLIAIGVASGILLALFVLVAMLLSLFVPRSSGPREDYSVAAATTQIEAFRSALEKYCFDTGSFPTTEQGLGALFRPTEDVGWDGPYMNKPTPPRDPWGNEYQYEYPPTHGSDDSPDIWSIGPDGVENTEDDICSWGLGHEGEAYW